VNCLKRQNPWASRQDAKGRLKYYGSGWKGKGSTMRDRHSSQALFQSIGKDGTNWLFVVGCDGGWAIMRNGKEFDIGTGETASVVGGVKNFLSLTHVIADCDVASDPVLTGLLDRIERGGSATGKVAKHLRKVRPYTSQASSALSAK
jgi:hypothetical protein